ncbi:outer membrane protein [Bartonella sp. A05]|uniref:outer membrane protein n=1 Tax=Bartonella sp. A05 TaxID=2967261 RepID=UPI0022A8E11E|nr:outer membrane protein [Bartonella sp. A05]MCZ2203359.1 porin family protein [Bartonella sp. A05]
MNMKYLVAASVAAIISMSVAQAADTMIPQEVASKVPSEVPSEVESIVVAPDFSWTGVYFGGQIGWAFGDAKVVKDKSEKQENSADRTQDLSGLNRTQDLSGLIGGAYAGYNVDLGRNFVLGVDTDVILSGKKSSSFPETPERKEIETGKTEEVKAQLEELGFSKEKIGNAKFEEGSSVELKNSVSLKEKWAGATRVVVGYALDRMMPYVAGGVAYGQIESSGQAAAQVRAAEKKLEKDGEDAEQGAEPEKGEYDLGSSSKPWDKTNTLAGFTLGAGVAYAVTDNIVARVEYRYTDYSSFGKGKFQKDILNKTEEEYSYKTNDFRVGVAYKF